MKGNAGNVESAERVEGRARKIEETVERIETKFDRFEKRLRDMETKIERCMSMMCTLLETDTKMQSVREWELQKENQRRRTQKCRSKKVDPAQSHRQITVKNEPMHSICKSFTSMRTSSKETPGLCKGMLKMLEYQLRRTGSTKPDPTAWFKMQVELQPAEHIVSFLVCLWNQSFWVPWCTHSSSRIRYFTGWKTDKPDSKPKTMEVSEGEVLMKVDPPQVWTDNACNKFCEAWIWKIYNICYKFVDDELPAFDWDDKAFADFSRLAKLWSSTSCYCPHRDFEWNVEQLPLIDRGLALKVYRRVADRLKTLRSAFLKGLNANLDDFFSFPDSS